MIKLTDIKKVFRTELVETWALRNVSLEVKEGEFVAIMGPSGCGKSTLLNILGLLDTPTEGTYTLCGKDVSTLTENERTDIRKGVIGFVFQSFNLIDELNVMENTELPLLYMGTPAKERKEKVNAVLDRMSMDHRKKHFPAQLSGGQQQRVAIARAICPFMAAPSDSPNRAPSDSPNRAPSDSPKGEGTNLQGSSPLGGIRGGLLFGCSRGGLLLADEPTGNLDSKNGKEVMDLLRQLHQEGTTIVMVTHSQHDATYADRIINLFDGEIVENTVL